MNARIALSAPVIGDAEKAAVMSVLDSGMLVQGPRTALFEKQFAEVVGVQHAVAVSSGTTALHVALLAHGIGPGDEVITSPFTFVASVNSIVYTGATPVFCDVSVESFNLNVSLLKGLLTPRTKAIMPVHLFGMSCDMTEILAFAREHHLAVIEDCAQSIGASYGTRMTGSMGTGCFSLYATKNVMSAEGGMITTNDARVADCARMLRAHGSRRRYYHELLGFNSRMTDLHAAIGVVQLGRLAEFTSRRQENAAQLSALLTAVRVPVVAPGRDHVWHQYTVRMVGATAVERDAEVARIDSMGISCGVFYPLPANEQQHLLEMGIQSAPTPVAQMLSREVFSLPVHPSLSFRDVARVAEIVNTRVTQ